MTQTKPFRLITIPISHYCEKVRWALTKQKISFVEEAHMPPFHLLATASVGGKLTPVLVTEDGTFTDSTDILKYLDSIASANVKLFPTNPELRKKVEELEELFDEKLGVATRRWAYSHIIDNSQIIKSAWSNGVPIFETMLFPVLFPVMRSLIQKKFDITANSGKEAYIEIQQVFEQVNQILADGRKYLVGDNLSIADITFAALAALVITPPEHPKIRNNPQELPVQMLSEIEQFRETVAGKFALQMYATERF
jgi:glutathione S-transferase